MMVLSQSQNVTIIFQIPVMVLAGGETLYDFTARVCFQYLGAVAFLFLKCLMVVNFEKNLLNLGMESYCLKCDDSIFQWVDLILV